MREMGEQSISVFHKGALNNGIVSGTKELSTGLEKASVDAIRKNGKLWEFKIPKNEFTEWKANKLVRELKDLDYSSGIYNHEIRFDPSLANKLNKYLIK